MDVCTELDSMIERGVYGVTTPKQLGTVLYWHVFNALDAIDGIDGEKAGEIATAVEEAFLGQMAGLDY